MKKRLFCVTVLILVLLCCLSCAEENLAGETASVENDQDKGYSYSILTDNTVQIIRYFGRDQDVVIPDVLGGRTVTAIGEKAFYGKNTIVSVSVPGSVATIGASAFDRCASLQKADLEEGVISIENSAFSDCASLTEVHLPRTLETIGERAFFRCESLKGIEIPEKIKIINEDTFYECDALTDVFLPEELALIKEWAFYGCSKLEYILLPDSLTEIGENAFSGCSELDDLVIPGSVEKIGSSAFWECRLFSVVLQEGVKEIGEAAFCSCSALFSISIPSSVTKIGKIAFYYNPYRTVTVYTPSGSYADRYARSEFYLEADNHYTEAVVNYPAQKPDYDGTLKYGPFRYVVQEDDTAVIVRYTGNSKTVEIPEAMGGCPVTAIGDGAFDGSSELETVVIPNSVIHVGKNPFSACPELNTIKVSAGHPSLAVIDNVLFRKADKCLVSYPEGSDETEYTVPKGIKTIGAYAFYGCTTLKSVTIPDTVTNIQERAFKRCRGLKHLVFPGSIEFIDEGVLDKIFSGAEAVVEKGSAAESYCLANGISVSYPDSLDWLND